ncbi:MAG: hypothetical protein P1V36_00020 [Planctomycetota bacterium]|nr:hypothetical protein [Planctomycetota bacterium]
MSDDIDYDSLDPGIRHTVRVLRSWGLNTTDSGDGSKASWMEGALEVPHVFSVNEPAETADWLLGQLVRHGVEVRMGMIEYTYDPVNGVGIIAFWGTVPDSVAPA